MKTLPVLIFLGAILTVLLAIAIAGRRDSACGEGQYFNDGRCQDCGCNELGSALRQFISLQTQHISLPGSEFH